MSKLNPETAKFGNAPACREMCIIGSASGEGPLTITYAVDGNDLVRRMNRGSWIKLSLIATILVPSKRAAIIHDRIHARLSQHEVARGWYEVGVRSATLAIKAERSVASKPALAAPKPKGILTRDAPAPLDTSNVRRFGFYISKAHADRFYTIETRLGLGGMNKLLEYLIDKEFGE